MRSNNRDDGIVLILPVVALYTKVSAFLTLTEEMCRKKIGKLDVEASSYKDLQAELRAINQPIADI